MALRGSIVVEGAGDSISTVELLEAMLTAGMTTKSGCDERVGTQIIKCNASALTRYCTAWL